MVVIGVDAHKRTHTLAVVDEVGRELANRTFRATLDGHCAVLRWIQRSPERMFALEDCRHLTRRLEARSDRGGRGGGQGPGQTHGDGPANRA
jgi:transposase